VKKSVVFLVVCCFLLGAPVVAAASGNDNIPGVPIPASPAQGFLDAKSNRVDVYSIAMRQSDRLSITLNGVSTLLKSGGVMEDRGIKLAVYGPDAMDIKGTKALGWTLTWDFPCNWTFSAPSDATYYFAISVVNSAAYGNYSMAYACQSPTIAALTSRPKTIRRGTSVSVAGSVKYAVNPAPISGAQVTLLAWAVAKEKWIAKASATTDSDGRFSFAVKPLKTTIYCVNAVETDTLLGSYSPMLKYVVR
jgi:hypothetical protein